LGARHVSHRITLRLLLLLVQGECGGSSTDLLARAAARGALPRYPRRMATRRRSSTRRRGGSTRRRSSRSAPRELPFVGPGERLWVLDVPYGTQVEGASWHPAVRMHLHVGRTLPTQLAPYAPGPHTLGRFLENQLNPGDPAPTPEPAEDLEP